MSTMEASRQPASSSSVARLEGHARNFSLSSTTSLSSHKGSSLHANNQAQSSPRGPALCHNKGESELESEDDGFDHTRSPKRAHDALELAKDATGEHDMQVNSAVDQHPKKLVLSSPPRAVFDDDGESEMEEPESEEEPDVPVHKPDLPPPSPVTFLHISHKLLPGHNRPFEELSAAGPSTVFAKDRSAGAPLVPYARAPPAHTHLAYQRAWLVPSPHIMHMKRREQMMFGESLAVAGPPPQEPQPSSPRSEPIPEILPQQFPHTAPSAPVRREKRSRGSRKITRRPYACLYRDCKQAFPSPKDRGRHMDKHFEGRFECLRCHKKYARLDALKRHSSEQFRPRLAEELNARSYNVSTGCVGGYEAKEWVELSGSRWLKHEFVVHLRVPEPHDPLHSEISRLLHEAHSNAQVARQPSEASARIRPEVAAHHPPPPLHEPIIKREPMNVELLDVDMITLDPEDRDSSPPLL
ncbi:hypothetical protein BC835DRAFT_1305550 [Cytidiella melzeri]|nr:hypothetical protein BC835DRAFT_1305550 [Cytidiella melzeri]